LGECYLWVRELGNEDYQGAAPPGVRRDARGAGVRLVDEEAGLAKVREMLERQAVILLCFEADERECHRGYVRSQLRQAAAL